jgi:hypothetical protein
MGVHCADTHPTKYLVSYEKILYVKAVAENEDSDDLL